MKRQSIAIRWYINDVKWLDNSLSAEDAWKILQIAKATHDCEIGINWNVLRSHINAYKLKEGIK